MEVEGKEERKIGKIISAPNMYKLPAWIIQGAATGSELKKPKNKAVKGTM